MTQVRAMAEREQEILDPPEFWSLADMQALRSAVVATFDDAVTWTNGPERSGQQQNGVFAAPLIRDAAQSTAAELGIPSATWTPLCTCWTYRARGLIVPGQAAGSARS